MILDEYVEVNVAGKTKQHYIDKGYSIPMRIDKLGRETTPKGTKILVNIGDLPKYSNTLVNVRCDCCGKQTRIKYQQYSTAIENYGEYLCQNCCNVHRVLTVRSKYNVDNISQTSEVKQKKEDTTYKKYGVSNVFQSSQIIEQIKQTMYQHGTIRTSSQQYYLNDLYGGELNYPIGYYNLDIYKVDEKIDIEVDFGGHTLVVKRGEITQEEFDKREMIRDKVIRSKGIKIIRLISPHDKLPSDEKLFEIYDFAKDYFTTGHTWINFYIEENKYRNAEHRNELGAFYDFGKLWNGKSLARKIKKEEVV